MNVWIFKTYYNLRRRPLLPANDDSSRYIRQTQSTFGFHMIPTRFAPFIFGFLLSAQMSLLISGVSTFRAIGLADGFFGQWIGAWLTSWCIAFPCVLVVAPITRKLVAVLTRQPQS